MSFVRKAVKNAAIGVAIADDPASLTTFLQPGCAAAIWRRQTASNYQHWFDSLDPESLPNARVVLPVNTVLDVVQQLCDMSGVEEGAERDWLESDIAFLAKTFSDLMQVKYLRLRIQAVTTNACRKFHVDAITARLVCTYRGTGTQYGISVDGDDPKRVFTVPTGAPILLRCTIARCS